MYKIVRFYSAHYKTRIVKKGLTLKEAQRHCRREDTKDNIIWFDGFTQE